MVRHLPDLHPLPRRLQGAGTEPQRPTLRLPSTTLRSMVRPVHVFHRLLRTSLRTFTVLSPCLPPPDVQFSGWGVFLKDSWDTASFVTNYLPLILFPILYVGAKLWKRTPMHRPEDMDFITGLKEIEADSCVTSLPPTIISRADWRATLTGTTSPHQGTG